MRQLFFFILTTLFVSNISFGQVTESINYQAVARNNAGAALAFQTIKVRFTITRDAVIQYSETRQATTNALGLFNVQIGSAGALLTTGTFNAIDWKNNTPNLILKVELDINNTNVFTDMGIQVFSTVPYAFAAKTAEKAKEVTNIAGRPIDAIATPTVGARLSWNGTNWIPVKRDSIYKYSSAGQTILAGGSNAPWVFAGDDSQLLTVTVTGNETIIANFSGAFGHAVAGGNAGISTSVCYQNVSGGTITEFNAGIYPSTMIKDLGGTTLYSMTMITVSGAVKLPAGTYKIGMGIKNQSNTINLSNNGSLNGYAEVKY